MPGRKAPRRSTWRRRDRLRRRLGRKDSGRSAEAWPKSPVDREQSAAAVAETRRQSTNDERLQRLCAVRDWHGQTARAPDLADWRAAGRLPQRSPRKFARWQGIHRTAGRPRKHRRAWNSSRRSDNKASTVFASRRIADRSDLLVSIARPVSAVRRSGQRTSRRSRRVPCAHRRKGSLQMASAARTPAEPECTCSPHAGRLPTAAGRRGSPCDTRRSRNRRSTFFAEPPASPIDDVTRHRQRRSCEWAASIASRATTGTQGRSSVVEDLLLAESSFIGTTFAPRPSLRKSQESKGFWFEVRLPWLRRFRRQREPPHIERRVLVPGDIPITL